MIPQTWLEMKRRDSLIPFVNLGCLQMRLEGGVESLYFAATIPEYGS
jgi:hypothetical protein